MQSLDLPTQAREIVLETLGSGGFVLNRDQPWKLTAARMIAGEDVRLGELTEVFRALGVVPGLITGKYALDMPGGRIQCATADELTNLIRMVRGESVDGLGLSVAGRKALSSPLEPVGIHVESMPQPESRD